MNNTNYILVGIHIHLITEKGKERIKASSKSNNNNKQSVVLQCVVVNQQLVWSDL